MHNTLQLSENLDHGLWRLLQTKKMLDDTINAYPEEVEDIDITTQICNIERKIALYTPKTVEGFLAKCEVIQNEYDEQNSRESEEKYSDVALVKSLFRDMHLFISHDVRNK